MERIYSNRYGDKIKFLDQDKGTVYVTGWETMSLRIGGEPDNIQMVDPSGGPYMAVGMNINTYIKDMNREITGIEIDGAQIKLKYKI